MNLYAPDYYNKFSCIANRCRHSCCIGWEIDIDEDSLNKYKSIKGDFGKRLLDNISTDETPHFILKQNERCPFLNENNLCDIIINSSENYLCQICADHPRFRNYFDSRIEIGLGLTCEEAARIILTNPDKVCIIPLTEDDTLKSSDDEIFFNFRNKILDIIQDRTLCIRDRISILTKTFRISLPKKTHTEWAEFLLNLEHLEHSWKERLLQLKSLKTLENILITDKKFEILTEQLFVYFIFRHLSDAQFNGSYLQRLAFCIIVVKIIDFLSFSEYIKKGTLEIADIIEISRQFSSEIEYSEENTEAILNLTPKNPG